MIIYPISLQAIWIQVLKRAQYLSDYYVENGSFLRMDNLNIGYNFPHFINDKYKLRVSLSAQNVFLITKYSGLILSR